MSHKLSIKNVVLLIWQTKGLNGKEKVDEVVEALDAKFEDRGLTFKAEINTRHFGKKEENPLDYMR